jgi:hypothetical protein
VPPRGVCSTLTASRRKEAEVTTRRNRRKQTIPFDQRLRQAAIAAREAAHQLPAGQERDALMKKASQAETAATINELLSSPPLRSSSSG